MYQFETLESFLILPKRRLIDGLHMNLKFLNFLRALHRAKFVTIRKRLNRELNFHYDSTIQKNRFVLKRYVEFLTIELLAENCPITFLVKDFLYQSLNRDLPLKRRLKQRIWNLNYDHSTIRTKIEIKTLRRKCEHRKGSKHHWMKEMDRF